MCHRSKGTTAKHHYDESGDGEHEQSERENVIEYLDFRPDKRGPLIGELIEKCFSKSWRQGSFFRIGLPVAGDPGGAKIRQEQSHDDDPDYSDAGRIPQHDRGRQKVGHVIGEHDRRCERVVLANPDAAEMKHQEEEYSGDGLVGQRQKDERH
jgi:hypothetical protein